MTKPCRFSVLRLGAILIPLVLAAFLCGCKCEGCDKERDRALSELGPPDERSTEELGGKTSETWYYWSLGKSLVFFSDEDDCSCAVNRYNFPPSENGSEAARGASETGEPGELLSFSTHNSYPFHP